MLYEVLIDIKDYEFYLPKRIFHNILSGKLPESRMNRVVKKFKEEGYANRINIETYKFTYREPSYIPDLLYQWRKTLDDQKDNSWRNDLFYEEG